MRKLPTLIALAAAAVVAAFVAYAWHADDRGAEDRGAHAGPLAVAGSAVEQGRYLAAAADCVGCHTVPGGAAYAGGVPFRLPFGTIYSTNLTPDRETGLGAWSDEDFLRAVRGGVAPGGRHLYPAHPYPSYAAMARDDVLAIRAYLASLPPVRSRAPGSELRFPFSQRWLMPLWNALYLDGRRFEADARHDSTWNRGAYLATALGHCGECHTPRNAGYALRGDRPLAGAVTQGWKAYDITADAESGVGAWTAAALQEYLASGHARGHGAAAGPMKEVVAYSTSQLTADDRAALATYLLGGAAPGGRATQAEAGAAAASPPRGLAGTLGESLYAGACASCHPLAAVPAPAYYADLRGSRTVRDPQGTNLLRLLADGSPHGAGDSTAMPAFGRGYTDTERAALANYVLAAWGNLPPGLTPNDARHAAAASR
ncbi:MAG: c-type cytochrome [Proteobacteria bacterium]|nr:c-type cytochrome [Pseudomonadota bacterium]